MTCAYLSQLIVLVKTGPTILALTAHQAPALTGWGGTSWVRCGFCELYSHDSFVYLCIPASETTLHRKECQLRIDLTFDDRL
jgi:hypothetical protein